MLSVAQRAVQGEFATLGALRAAVREQAKQIKLALSREAVQLAGKECALFGLSVHTAWPLVHQSPLQCSNHACKGWSVLCPCSWQACWQ